MDDGGEHSVPRDLTRSRYQTVPRCGAWWRRCTIEWCTHIKSVVLFYGMTL